MTVKKSGKVPAPPTTNRGVTKSQGSPSWNGVDYYTATSRSTDAGDSWFSIWNTYRLQVSGEGEKLNTFMRHSYKCSSIGGLTFGKSDEFGYMIVASSDVAATTWQKVLPKARNITRLDLQYTFIGEGSKSPRGEKESYKSLGPIMREYVALKESDFVRGRVFDCRENSKGGETLYVGSRNSEQMGRFYNKSVESGLDVSNVYRMEVEFKKPRSMAVYKDMYKDLSSTRPRPTYIRDVVCSWFEKRGVLPDNMFFRVEPVQVAKVISSDDKKLKWLRTSIAPTLSDLADRGKLKEIAEALDLTKSQYRQLAMFSSNDLLTRECRHALSGGICQKCGQCFT